MIASDKYALFCGIDLGTSGVRGVCVDRELTTVASNTLLFSQAEDDRRHPATWWDVVCDVLSSLTNQVDPANIVGIAIDGTSGTMLPVNENGEPVADAKMYNDTCTDASILKAIATHAPHDSAVHGATSALARAIMLATTPSCTGILHEADWIAYQLGGLPRLSDENNALKTGYNPIIRQWPQWIKDTGIPMSFLPRVVPAGTLQSAVSKQAAHLTGLIEGTRIVTGTTDGCASFLATGANIPGDGVTVLGSTLTIKLLSDKPIYSPAYGIYSHRIGDRWLAGGASNTGGKVLAHFFTAEQIASLSAKIDTNTRSSLCYYPLLTPGERFPINDSTLQPRMNPRPDNDVTFLHGLLEGIANIELQGYQRLQELGGPALRSIRTVGGGARNSTWSSMRKRKLDIPIKRSISDEAAVGVASLARDGCLSSIEAGNLIA